MPDPQPATPSDGGYRVRTGDLLLAKARTPVHQRAADGTPPRVDTETAAAAATHPRTPAETQRESLSYLGIAAANAQARLERQYAIAAEAAARTGMCAGSDAADGLIPRDVLEHRARRLAWSEAQHILRVRAQHSAIAQRHVRTAVGW